MFCGSILPYLSKLSEQINQGSFTKRVVDAGMKRHRWVNRRQNGNPFLLKHLVTTYNLIKQQSRQKQTEQQL